MTVWTGQLIATAVGIIIITAVAFGTYLYLNPRPKKRDTHNDSPDNDQHPRT